MTKKASVKKIRSKKRKTKKRKNKNYKNPNLIIVAIIVSLVAYFAFYYARDLDGEVIVHFIDIGQGDATLIQTSEGVVLIDGGDRHTSDDLLAYLRGLGINNITYLIATHPHSDHIGGLIYVLREMTVENIMMPRVMHTTITFEDFIIAIEESELEVQAPIINDTFSIGGALFTVLAPNSSGYSSLNDYSIVLRMDYGNTSFLFTGDAESISEHEMLENNHNVSVNVLQVGHHGSSTSTTQDFLDAVSPQVAVISVGANNRYGHPHSSVVNRLQKGDIIVYRTDIHGTIVMSTNGIDIIIH